MKAAEIKQPVTVSAVDAGRNQAHDVVGLNQYLGSLTAGTAGISFMRMHQKTGYYVGQAPSIWSINRLRAPLTLEETTLGDARITRQHLLPGTVGIVPPDIPFENATNSEIDAEYVLLSDERVRAALPENHCGSLDFLYGDNFFRHSDLVSQLILTLLNRVERAVSQDTFYATSMVNALVTELYADAGAPVAYRQPKANDLCARKMRTIEDHVNSHLNAALSPGDLAAAVGMPEATFLRSFKSASGMTAYQYVITRRIERARGLLRDSDMTIAQIAYVTGFSSQSHMTDVFRSKLGTSPGAMRKRSAA